MAKTVFFAKNSSDLLYQIKTTKDLEIVGGCTRVEEIPDKYLSVRKVEELSKIERHERYIDVGPGVTLSQLLALGENHLPKVLYDAILSVANPNVRNLATIGGNILETNQKLTLFAPLLALDTRLDFESSNDKTSIMLQNFKSIPEGFILKNIHIPLTDGDISIFRRTGPEHSINETSASFAFIAETEKNTIAKISLAFAGPFAFRSKDFENPLLGLRLPLSKATVKEIQESARDKFNESSRDIMMDDVMRQQFINLVRYAFEQLM
ncbi:MAG: FAD binding domain-containing protein [Treponema sp.]|nr:FAD binding domain-containing protein [Treponema sp.]